MLSGSGASNTVMKSYSPGKAYWERTFAPNASTSWKKPAIAQKAGLA